MMYNFLDTSAVLENGLKTFSNIYISPITLMELEHIKSSSRDSSIKYKAREAIRNLLNEKNINYANFSQKKIAKIYKQYPFLMDIPDHKILCEAALLGEKNCVHFITKDISQYLFGKKIKTILSEYLHYKDDEYRGWSERYPSEQQLADLYSNTSNNIFNCSVNEFVKIYDEKSRKLNDVLFWDGKNYRSLKYKPFTAPTGEKISPRNIEQKMYLDLLQNDNIPIKLCIGRFGSGKSLFAETWAAHQLQMGKYDKIVFVKNNLEVKGAGKLGILPGDEIDKQLPWLRQIEDHLGPQLFEQYLSEGRLEPTHLSTIRGRDLKNCIILVDEAENLLTTNIQLLLGRVADNSQIIFCADVKQCDYQDEKMSGIPVLIERLRNRDIFGMVKLIKPERGVVSAAADLLD